jgi:hypothetical protein
MPIEQAQFRYGVPLSGSFVVRVATDVSTADLTIGPFDPYTDWLMLADGTADDALEVFATGLETHAGIVSATPTLDTETGIVTWAFTYTGGATTTNLLWSHVNTTGDATQWGWLADTDSGAGASLVTPAVPMGLVPTIGGRPVSTDSRPRQRIVGGIARSISNLTRATTWGTPALERTLSVDLLQQDYALDEYAPVTAPYATIESMLRSLGQGLVLHYIPDAANPATYSVMRLAVLAPGPDHGLTRSGAGQFIRRWAWTADFVVSAEVVGDAEVPFAPFDVGGSELYLAAAPLAHCWQERDGDQASTANTRVSAAAQSVGRVDSAVYGHVASAGADAQRPLYRTTGAHPHFEFDGTDDRWSVHNTQGTSTQSPLGSYWITGIGSVLMRLGFRNDGVAASVLNSRGSAGTGLGFSVTRDTSNRLVITATTTGPTNVFSYTTTATITAAMGIVPVEIRLNNASGGDVRINSGSLETFARSNAPAAASAGGDLFIGSREGGGAPAQLDLADVLMTSTYANDAECTAWRTLGLSAFPATFFRRLDVAPWFNFCRRWHDLTQAGGLWTNAGRTVAVASNGDTVLVTDNLIDGATQHLNRTLTVAANGPAWQSDGSGCDFDGTNDSLAGSATTRDNQIGGAFTMVFVVRNDDAVSSGQVANGNSGTSQNEILATATGLQFNAVTGSATAAVSTGAANAFTAYALVRDGSAYRLYARVGGVDFVGLGSSVLGFRFLSLGIAGTATLDGRIAEYLRFNVPLDADDVAYVFDELDARHPSFGIG